MANPLLSNSHRLIFSRKKKFFSHLLHLRSSGTTSEFETVLLLKPTLSKRQSILTKLAYQLPLQLSDLIANIGPWNRLGVVVINAYVSSNPLCADFRCAVFRKCDESMFSLRNIELALDTKLVSFFHSFISTTCFHSPAFGLMPASCFRLSNPRLQQFIQSLMGLDY